MVDKVFDEFDDDLEKQVSVLQQTVLNLTIKEMELGNTIEKLEVEINKLREAQKESGERLNAVVFMVKKFFSDQNGKSKK
jgi:chaperonin cofactor prefoldin